MSDSSTEEENECSGKKLGERKKISYREQDEKEDNVTVYAKKIQKLSHSKQIQKFRLKENNRAKLYRLSLSDEQKKKSNELTKERMIRYRERLKEKQTGKPAKVPTRKEAKEEEDAKGRMRVYWRGKKRESRARESTVKKEFDNIKQKEKYGEIKAEKNLFTDAENISTCFQEEGTATCSDSEINLKENDYRSPDVARKAISRCSKNLPQTPEKWLKVADNILKRAMPRKIKLLDESGLVVSPKTREEIEVNCSIVQGVRENIKPSRSRKKKHFYRRSLISTVVKHAKEKKIHVNIRKHLGIQWRNLVSKSYIQEEEDNRKRSDALREVEVQEIQDCYLKPSVSVELPSRSTSSRMPKLKKRRNVPSQRKPKKKPKQNTFKVADTSTHDHTYFTTLPFITGTIEEQEECMETDDGDVVIQLKATGCDLLVKETIKLSTCEYLTTDENQEARMNSDDEMNSNKVQPIKGNSNMCERKMEKVTSSESIPLMLMVPSHAKNTNSIIVPVKSEILEQPESEVLPSCSNPNFQMFICSRPSTVESSGSNINNICLESQNLGSVAHENNSGLIYSIKQEPVDDYFLTNVYNGSQDSTQNCVVNNDSQTNSFSPIIYDNVNSNDHRRKMKEVASSSILNKTHVNQEKQSITPIMVFRNAKNIQKTTISGNMGDNSSHSMGDNSSHNTGGNSTTNLFSDQVKVPRLQTKDSGTDRLNGNQILVSELDNTDWRNNCLNFLKDALQNTINRLEDLGVEVAAWVLIHNNDKSSLIRHMGSLKGREFIKSKPDIDAELHLFLQNYKKKGLYHNSSCIVVRQADNWSKGELQVNTPRRASPRKNVKQNFTSSSNEKEKIQLKRKISSVDTDPLSDDEKLSVVKRRKSSLS